MNERIKFGSVLAPFGNPADRYVLSGYKKEVPVSKMLQQVAKLGILDGVELIGTWHVTDKNLNHIKKIVKDLGLTISCITPDIWAQAKWGYGSISVPNKGTRDDAIEEVKKAMDFAVELGCQFVDVWLAQDGYDYPFQTDYTQAWENIVLALRECADYRKDVKLLIEYKIKEPRTHCFIGTAAKTLLLINELNKGNVGVLVDVGHAWMAYENVAESIALLKRSGDKLWYMHFNDNYQLWDDDMIAGSLHIVEYLELLYWLDRTEYNGWFVLDIFPYREDGIQAVRESIDWLKGLRTVLGKVDSQIIEETIRSRDGVKASQLVRKMLF
ncbi:MAG: sugar phosphate isomerase/epimerase [Actinobacteria bacterium]|nr:sugar phosphate isomerase/epimerase [Actinomycetota bacterium]